MTSKLIKTLFILILVAVFLVLVVSRTPAAWAAWAIHKAAPNVWFTGVSGTLWKGQAASAQVDVGSESIALGEMNWQLKAWSLLILSPCMDLSAQLPGQSISGRVCRSILGGSNKLKNLNVDAPMALFSKVTPLNGTGAVSLQVLSASFNSQAVDELDGRLSWQNANVFVEGQWFNLGSFGAELSDDGQGGAAAKISDIAGPYTLAMDANWAPGKPWQTKGQVTPKPGVPEVVIQALQVFGEDVGSGTYAVQFP